MANRRVFLKTLAGAAAGGALLSTARRAGIAQGGPPPCIPPEPPLPPSLGEDGRPLAPFVDRLRIPPILRPKGRIKIPDALRRSGPLYQVPMRQVMQKLHRNLPPTPVWGYWGMYPGPTFEVKRGRPIAVEWLNELPEEHILVDSLDRTLHGTDNGEPDVRTVVHLHGGRTKPESDGHPEAWFTPGFAEKGPFPNSGIFFYTNDQPSTMLWYHDHALGITRLNVIAGLAGLYFIRDDDEEELGLPKGKYEIPLVIQDKRFNADGSIFYPEMGILPPALGGHPLWFPDYGGDVAVVNGKVFPFVEVEPRKYRLRMLNAANTTFFNLKLEAESGPGPSFVQIGADVGFLPRPVVMPSILMGNAERVDVIVDFADFDGQNIIMTNDALNPFPLGFLPTVPEIMQFRVRRKNNDRDRSRIPATLPAPPALQSSQQTLQRDILLTEDTVLFAPPNLPPPAPPFCPIHVPRHLLVEDRHWEEPVITVPVAGSTEIWRFINATVLAHPMHVHLARMQVLDRQPFNLEKYLQTGQIETLGPAQPPAPNEVNAPKDTVRVDLGTLTRALVHFDIPTYWTVDTGDKLRYVHHCHMLEHEDNDMMRPYDIVVPAGFGDGGDDHGHDNDDDDDDDRFEKRLSKLLHRLKNEDADGLENLVTAAVNKLKQRRFSHFLK